MFYLRIDNETQQKILISLLDHEIFAQENSELYQSDMLKQKKIIRDRLLIGTKRGEKNRN
jgi:uncharacterized protein YqgQ